jgi:hypothetical protein
MGPREIALIVVGVFLAIMILLYLLPKFALIACAIQGIFAGIKDKLSSRKEKNREDFSARV